MNMSGRWMTAAVVVGALAAAGIGCGGAAAQTNTIIAPTVADLVAQMPAAANAPVAAPGGAAIQGGVAVTEHIAAGNGNAALPAGSAMPPMVSTGIVADAR